MAAKENVVVSSVGNTRSVCVQLHPLVIMNISDHYTRIRSQANGGNPQGRIGFFLHEHKLSFAFVYSSVRMRRIVTNMFI